MPIYTALGPQMESLRSVQDAKEFVKYLFERGLQRLHTADESARCDRRAELIGYLLLVQYTLEDAGHHGPALSVRAFITSVRNENLMQGMAVEGLRAMLASTFA